MEQVIITENLTKFYRNKRGIVDVCMEIYKGEVFGYLGPNGAGKTTTIRLLLNLIKPTKGNAYILGRNVSKDDSVRKHVGYMPGDYSLYNHLTGEELLKYLGKVRKRFNEKLIKELINRFDIDVKRKIKELSKGNKQKLCLLQAFLHDPEILIFDEPTSGFDPIMQQEFYNLVREFKNKGYTFFISSHNLPEVEKICDRVGIIKDGNLVLVEKMENIRKRIVKNLEIHFSNNVKLEDFIYVKGVKSIEVKGNVLKVSLIGDINPFIKKLGEFEIEDIKTHDSSLEDVFYEYFSSDHKR